MATGRGSLNPPEWVENQKLENDTGVRVVKTGARDLEAPAVASAAPPSETPPLKALSISSRKNIDEDQWLGAHHNPDSPIHSPVHSPDRDPTGANVHERWDHWLHLAQWRHGLVSKDEEANGKPKKPRGLIGGFYHWLANEKPAAIMPVFMLVLAVVMVGAWGSTTYFLTGKRGAPKGDLFAIFCLWILAYAVGDSLRRVSPTLLGAIVTLLGAIVAGFILRFIPGIKPQDHIKPNTRGNLRSIALVIILLRAGMSLDVKTLGKLPALCFIMPTIPLISEACIVAVLSHALLNFTWKWAFMGGFLISAVSPAVVVPVLLQLAGQGYGLEKGIPSLVLAVAALCDVFSIAGFSVWQTITFDKTTIVESIFRAPMELAMGIGAGLGLGALAVLIAPRSHIVTGHEPPEEYKALRAQKNLDDRKRGYVRAALTLGLGLFAYFGFHKLEYNGAGAMSVFVLGTAVAMGWGRSRTARVQGNLASVWVYVASPILFGIIGVVIDYNYFYGRFLWKALVILLTAMVARMMITFVAATGSHLNTKEKIFLAVAWIPKATVQAALGPVAYITIQSKLGKNSHDERIAWGKEILALAILAILLTAPIGAIFMALFGPKLLTKNAIPEGGVHLAAH